MLGSQTGVYQTPALFFCLCSIRKSQRLKQLTTKNPRGVCLLFTLPHVYFHSRRVRSPPWPPMASWAKARLWAGSRKRLTRRLAWSGRLRVSRPFHLPCSGFGTKHLHCKTTEHAFCQHLLREEKSPWASVWLVKWCLVTVVYLNLRPL